jgi:hypothetical protein
MVRKARRFTRRLPLKLLALGLISFYTCLSAFLFLCLFHPDADNKVYGHQHGVHGACIWVQKTASAYLAPASPTLYVLGSILLGMIPLVFPLWEPSLRSLSIRAPPLSLR